MQVQADPTTGADVDLRHYLRVISRRRWVIIGIAVAVGLASLGWSLTKEDRYRAHANLLLRAPTTAAETADALSSDPERAIANEVEILGSEEMQAAVAEEIGPGFPGVSASGTGENDVIELTAESADPEAAKEAVNTYASTYERLRRQRIVQSLRRQRTEINAGIRDKQHRLEEIQRPLRNLEAQMANTPPGPALDALQTQHATLESSIAPTRNGILSEISALDDQRSEIQAAMRNPTGGVEVLNSASTPSEPFYPQPKKDLLVGIVIGLLLGLATAFVWEQLDDRVRSKADADRATDGLPVLGLVPRVAGWRDRAEPRLVSRVEPHSPAAEAYRGLVTSLEFLAATGNGAVFLFTSPGASEGKTTTVANLGLAFAHAGHRTVVVDADLRRPRVHRFYDVEGSVGLTTVLEGKIDVATATLPVPDDVPLSVVPAGPIPPNPAEMLRSEATEAAITKLQEGFDVVLIDCPPVLPVADALVVARHVDAALLVAAADATSRRRLGQAVEALVQVDAPLKGIVLNGVGASDGYEYGYYAAQDDEGGKRRRRRRRAKA